MSRDTVIVFHGGGNVGDYYHEHVEFLKKLVKLYPENRIVVFSQTVYYKDRSLEKEDLSFCARHKDLFFCARDAVSFEIAKSYFGEKALLVPDTAFYIDLKMLESYKIPVAKDKLIIKRIDNEKISSDALSSDGEIRDWPTLVNSFRMSTFINKILYRLAPLHVGFINNFWNSYARNHFFYNIVREGVHFISQYKRVETTRLHGCILSILLDKKDIVLIDNSYGKNKNFYNTWLKDLDTVKLKDK